LGLGAGGGGAGVAPGAWTAAGWVAAAAALAVGSSTRTPGSPPAAVLAAAGVAAMAVCERAAILRMDPALGPAGAAASHGAPIAAAALAVLAGLPVLARHHGAPAPAGRRLREKGQVARAELQGRRRDVVLEV
ncbi:MAG TPA: hypothetical protein VFO60_04475, partial [Candidatus Dormibacteraeota bacterium]|nr:hypothetical protein [Candidatus Dormibacteraeota bacterium]